MRWNKLCVWLVSCFLCLWVTEGVAQDVVPVKSRPDRHSGHVSDSKAMQQLLKFIQVSNPMPVSFRETTETGLKTRRENSFLLAETFCTRPSAAYCAHW